METALAEPRARRLIDHALQAPTMDRELRYVEARVEPTLFTPDLLPEAVEVEQLVGADRDRVKPLQQSELLQLPDGMRQGVGGDAEVADGIGLLIDLAIDAARMQHQRGDEPANSAADDDRLHARRLHKLCPHPEEPEQSEGVSKDGDALGACGHPSRLAIARHGRA